MSKSFKVILLALVLLGIGLGVFRYTSTKTVVHLPQWDSPEHKAAQLAELEERRARAEANRPTWEVFAEQTDKPADPSKSEAAAAALKPAAAPVEATTWAQ